MNVNKSLLMASLAQKYSVLLQVSKSANQTQKKTFHVYGPPSKSHDSCMSYVSCWSQQDASALCQSAGRQTDRQATRSTTCSSFSSIRDFGSWGITMSDVLPSLWGKPWIWPEFSVSWLPMSLTCHPGCDLMNQDYPKIHFWTKKLQ